MNPNIGILSISPEATITELIECNFLQRLGMDGVIVCFTASCMHVRSLANFLLSNRIGVLIIEKDFQFDFSCENFGLEELLETLDEEGVLVMRAVD